MPPSPPNPNLQEREIETLRAALRAQGVASKNKEESIEERLLKVRRGPGLGPGLGLRATPSFQEGV